jgi:adenine-specific DNA-methyltransferase
MKQSEGYNKLRGGYYTPELLARFISEWAISGKKQSILEPSCGDGIFLKAIQARYAELKYSKTTLQRQVLGIELDPVEADKARKYKTSVINEDFFSYYGENIEDKKKYDVIVGNPPFIRYQNFLDKYRDVAFQLMRKHGFHPNRLTNIWLPFLLLSCEALTDDGRIGMVIPAELFQVNYAEEARLYLSKCFDNLTLVTFKHLVFDEIQQEVILLLGEKESSKKGIRVVELDGIEELQEKWMSCLDISEVNELNRSSEKWLKYYLSHDELHLLNRLNGDKRISEAAKLFEVNVGLVSGENEFFVINKKRVDEFDLSKNVIPIISRSEQVKGIIFNNQDYQNLIERQKKVYLFFPKDKPFGDLPENVQKYITWGEKQGYSQNYKCRIRKRWYIVPQSWTPDAYLIRQANGYPRMIIDNKRALVTDTLHKVRFLPGIDGNQVAAAYLNSYTLALSETLGRSYGGGVLTFEPSEMRQMRIPMKNADKIDLQYIDKLQREGSIDEILDYNDEILLKRGLRLSAREVKMLRNIWIKMSGRRLMRKTTI